MAAAFDQFSPAALPANVLALPAVAPAMWLGHADRDRRPGAAAAGRAAQLARLALPRLHRAGRALAGRPDWALLTVHLGSVWSVGGSVRRALDCDGAAPAPGRSAAGAMAIGRSLRPKAGGLAAVAIVAVLCWRPGPSVAAAPPHPQAHLSSPRARRRPGRLDPAAIRPTATRCSSTPDRRAMGWRTGFASSGSTRLAAIVITHDQSDHAGDLGELLGSVARRSARLRAGRSAAARRRPRVPARRPTAWPRAASSTRAACA